MERVGEAGRMLCDRKSELKRSIRRETEELGRIEAALAALGVSWSGDSNPSPDGCECEDGAVDPRVAEHGGATVVGVGPAPVDRKTYREPRTKKRGR